MKLLRGAYEAFKAALVDIARRPLFSLLSIAAMAVAILVVAGFLIVSRGAREVFGRLAAEAAVEVYLKDDATPEAIAELSGRLARNPAVRRVEPVSRQQAAAEFARLYPEIGDVRALLGNDALPASLRVVAGGTDPAALAALAQEAREHPATLSVRYDREWLESLARIGKALHLFALSGSIVLLLAALVTVGAVVRLALDDKLDEVRLLRLVGAPASYVLGPVLIAGGLIGGAGAGIALVLVTVARGAVLGWSQGGPFGAMAHAAFGDTPLPLGMAALLAGAGLVAGAASALFAAGRAALR